MAFRMFPRLPVTSSLIAQGNCFPHLASSGAQQQISSAFQQQFGAVRFASKRRNKNIHDNMITVVAISDQIPSLNAKSGDRILVKRGYFRNYLQRRKYAVYATPENLSYYDVDLEAAVITKSGDDRKRKTQAIVYDTEYANRIARCRLRLAFESSPDQPTAVPKPLSKYELWKKLRRKYVLPHLTLESLNFSDPEESQIATFGSHTLTADVFGAEGDLQKIPFTVEVMDTRQQETEVTEDGEAESLVDADAAVAELGGSFS